MLGASFDQFHRNPGRQRSLLANLKGEHRTQIQVGGLHMRLIANPIADENGARLGSVIEWLDRTAEVNAEKEIGAIVEAAAAGDFTKRIAEAGKAGFFLEMARGLNAILGTSEQALSEISRILKAMAEGDLAQTIEAEFKGVFADAQDQLERDHRAPARDHRPDPRGERVDQHGGARNRDRQQRPVAPHRGAGVEP